MPGPDFLTDEEMEQLDETSTRRDVFKQVEPSAITTTRTSTPTDVVLREAKGVANMGIGGLADLLGAATDVGGYVIPPWPKAIFRKEGEPFFSTGPAIRRGLGDIGILTERRPETAPGRVAGTVAEYLPGALIPLGSAHYLFGLQKPLQQA